MHMEVSHSVYKSVKLNIFFRLRKPGLVPGESLSPATIFGSVLEKINYTDLLL